MARINKSRPSRISVIGKLSAFTACIALLVTGCSTPTSGGSDDSDEGIPLRIGIPASNYWPAYVAKELDLYKKAGFKVEFVSFTSGAPLIAALQSGSIDAVFTGLATLFAVQQNVPLTYLYTPIDSSSQEGLVTMPDSNVKSFKDLEKARAIGVPTATCAQISFITAAESAGIDPAKVKVVNVAPHLLDAALDKGDIDSAFIWGPWNLQMKDAGKKIVNWDADYQPLGGLCATNVAIRPAYATANPTASCRLVMVQDLALEAHSKDPKLAPKTMENVLGVSPKIAQETVDTLKIPSLESQVTQDGAWSVTNTTGGLAAKLSKASEILTKAGVFKKAISMEDMSKMIDPKPLQQYLDKGSCT